MEPVDEEQRPRVERSTPPPDPRYEQTPVRRGAEFAEPVVPVRPVVETRVYDPRLERAVWFVGGLIATLIAIRFVMKLLGASYQADFVRFIYGVTGVLVAPFRGIFQATGSGNYILEPESLIAIAIYLLITWAAVAVIRIMTTPKTRVG